MRTLRTLAGILVLLVSLSGCAATPDAPPRPKPDPVHSAAAEISDRLSMPLTGKTRSLENTISATEDKTSWSYLQIACEQGGYDLTPYSEKRVTLTEFDTPDPAGNGHRRLHIMSYQGRVIGAYISREGEVPGISGVG